MHDNKDLETMMYLISQATVEDNYSRLLTECKWQQARSHLYQLNFSIQVQI